MDEAEAGPFVDVACGVQHVVGPEGELFVSVAPCEPDAFLDEAGADAQAPRFGLYQKYNKYTGKYRYVKCDRYYW